MTNNLFMNNYRNGGVIERFAGGVGCSGRRVGPAGDFGRECEIAGLLLLLREGGGMCGEGSGDGGKN